MNTRAAIQPSNTPPVVSLSFSTSRNRFIAGLADGIRVFRTDNCLTTCRPTLPSDGGIAIAAALDDRYIAYVAGGRTPAGSPNVVVFWDCVTDREITRFDLYEPVVGLRLSRQWLVVVLRQRTVVFEYQEFSTKQQPSPPPDDDDHVQRRTNAADEEMLTGPNRIKAILPTSANPYGIASLSGALLVLPAQTPGQVQIVPLRGGSKRVFRAHNTALRHVALSPGGQLLATASEQGTLVRVFDSHTLDQLAEFRRGVDRAIVHNMAFSDGGRWLAVTSDKGTVHVFDLRPSSPGTADQSTSPPSNVRSGHPQHRRGQSNPVRRLSTGMDRESLSGRSSPSTITTTHQGSIQEYYGLRPPPASASPTGRDAAASAITAFRSSSLAPRIFKDIRSVANMPFHTGNNPPHWQGGVAFSWTTAPGGTKKRVSNPIPALPADPSGKPPNGVVAFAQMGDSRNDDDGCVFYNLSGGSDARWEMFELFPVEGGRWVLTNRGFRKYMTRQFVD